MKERLFKSRTVLLFLHIIFWPFVLSFRQLNAVEKQKVVEDIITMNQHRNISLLGTYGLLYHLLTNKYYRNIYYLRIGKKSYFFSWLLPEAVYFYPCRNIGGGVYLAHPYATIINAKSVGKNFSIRQCTTIGNKRDGEGRNGPTIGDNVSLGANVCIIGDIRIGNNVTIGAGTVVVKDVPDNCMVVGNPARIISISNS